VHALGEDVDGIDVGALQGGDELAGVEFRPDIRDQAAVVEIQMHLPEG
jgi:hypothetical protein